MIIEKLGIAEIEVTQHFFSTNHYIDELKVRQLEQQRNEMLEALIDSGITNHWFSIKMQRAVERATSKTWKEIKELL